MTNKNLWSWNRLLGWVAVGVIALDWFTKFLVLNRIALYERVAVLDGWVYLVRTHNRGIAFSILGDSTAAWRTPLLIAGALVAVLVLGYFASEIPGRWARLGTALILGGALGNLGDRVANGGVTDFLLFRGFPYIFNVADAALVIGSVLLALTLLRAERAGVTKVSSLMLALSIGLAACGDDDPVDPADLTFASELNVNLSAMTKTASGLYYKDEVVGTGTQAAVGFNLSVDYTGWLHDGTMFDSSTGKSPITFVLGIGQVIRGWDEGLLGMRVGGRRQLVIPAHLAYGAEGRGQIPPNATLVFRVDLRAATR